MKTKKIDKEFCFTDESVNVYGYRCLTSGLQLDEVKKNPIGFKMHNRENGVVVRWEDFRIDGDKVYAKPVINLSHPEGETIVSEIENGFLNGASAGKIVVLDASDEKHLMIPGQTKPTVTKWFPREISLVDIPGNYNALANLFDINNNPLSLADFSKVPSTENTIKLAVDASILSALKLNSNATQSDFNNAIQNLINKSNELDSLKKSTVSNEVENILKLGVSDKKLTQDLANELKRSYANNPIGLRKLVDTMPYLGIPNDLQNKTWDELYSTNKLELVRTKYPVLYEQLKAEKYPVKK